MIEYGEKGDETRQHIKEQAKILFSKKGFKVVTMKGICEATGLSRGGLYRQYNSIEKGIGTKVIWLLPIGIK